ncbi:type I restriction endonuclease subunit S [bacterium]|nr:type I restriction endonuclease subunit S [bacterium]
MYPYGFSLSFSFLSDTTDKELLKIDQLSEKVTTAIEKLKEYRTSLVTSAVTGKIDLRNWQLNN